MNKPPRLLSELTNNKTHSLEEISPISGICVSEAVANKILIGDFIEVGFTNYRVIDITEETDGRILHFR